MHHHFPDQLIEQNKVGSSIRAHTQLAVVSAITSNGRKPSGLPVSRRIMTLGRPKPSKPFQLSDRLLDNWDIFVKWDCIARNAQCFAHFSWSRRSAGSTKLSE